MTLCDQEGRPRPTSMVVMVAWIPWWFDSVGGVNLFFIFRVYIRMLSF